MESDTPIATTTSTTPTEEEEEEETEDVDEIVTIETDNIPNQPDTSRETKKSRFVLGITLLLLVDFIWVASSELTEYIFHSQSFNKPFFSTYLKTSIFTIFLVGFIFYKPWTDQLILFQWGRSHNNSSSAIYNLLTQDHGDDVDIATNSPQNNNDEQESINALSSPTFIPINYEKKRTASGNETDTSSNHSNYNGDGGGKRKSVRFSQMTEVRTLSESEANDALLARLSFNASLEAEILIKRLRSKYGIGETAKLSLTFCLLWFLGSYTYQLSISNTEAGIVNLLSSTSSLFTLLLASCFPSNKLDAFTLSKLVSVLVSFIGVVLVTLSDQKLEHQSIPFGSIYSILSALFYSIYLVFLKRKVKDESKLDLYMFFGFVGLFNLLLLWPLFFVLNYLKIEDFECPNRQQLFYMLLNGLIGTVGAELLWLWGSLLTTSLIATLSVTLTIPLTIASDLVFKGIHYSLLVYLGMVPMLVSFIVVSLLTHYGNTDPIMICLRWIGNKTCSRHGNRTHDRRLLLRENDEDDEQGESLLVEDNCNDDDEIQDVVTMEPVTTSSHA